MKKDTLVLLVAFVLVSTIGLFADPITSASNGAANIALNSMRPVAIVAVIIGGLSYMVMRERSHGILGAMFIGLVIALGGVGIVNLVGGWVGGG